MIGRRYCCSSNILLQIISLSTNSSSYNIATCLTLMQEVVSPTKGNNYCSLLWRSICWSFLSSQFFSFLDFMFLLRNGVFHKNTLRTLSIWEFSKNLNFLTPLPAAIYFRQKSSENNIFFYVPISYRLWTEFVQNLYRFCTDFVPIWTRQINLSPV